MRSQSRSRHFVLFAALAGSTFLAGCSGAPSAQTAEPLVATAVAQGEGGAAGEAYTGTVHARTESVLASVSPSFAAEMARQIREAFTGH